MSADPAKTMSDHFALRTESCAGLRTPQRNCTGPCKKRKSHTQFTSGSAMCTQCTRRTPKSQGAAS